MFLKDFLEQKDLVKHGSNGFKMRKIVDCVRLCALVCGCERAHTHRHTHTFP